MKLSSAQRAVLELLAKHACHTGRWTYSMGFGSGVVNGTVAKSLVKAGLAKYARGWQLTGSGQTVVEITDAGRLAIGDRELHRSTVTGTDPCICGHSPEEHGHDPKHPGSTGCMECGCIAYDADPCVEHGL